MSIAILTSLTLNQPFGILIMRRGVEQWQLVGLITRRSLVRIQPPLVIPCKIQAKVRLLFAHLFLPGLLDFASKSLATRSRRYRSTKEFTVPSG